MVKVLLLENNDDDLEEKEEAREDQEWKRDRDDEEVSRLIVFSISRFNDCSSSKPDRLILSSLFLFVLKKCRCWLNKKKATEKREEILTFT